MAILIVVFAQPIVHAQQVKSSATSHERNVGAFDQKEGISDTEFQYYAVEMKKANFKFDPKNRDRNLVEELRNNPIGDSLRHLFRNMSWAQKALTRSKYHLFLIPKEANDSLSTTDFDYYNKLVDRIIPKEKRVYRYDKQKSYESWIKAHPTSKNVHYIGLCVAIINDSLYEKYDFLNAMKDYMSLNQVLTSPYIVDIIENFRKPKPISPTSIQMDKWAKNPKLWGVWLNEKRISNAELSKYKPSDIYYFDASNLAANARKLDGFNVQLGLFTKAGYDKTFKDWK